MTRLSQSGSGANFGHLYSDADESIQHISPETLTGGSWNVDNISHPGFNWTVDEDGKLLLTTPSHYRLAESIYNTAVKTGLRFDSVIMLENGNYAFGSTTDGSIALISPAGKLIEIISGQQNQEA